MSSSHSNISSGQDTAPSLASEIKSPLIELKNGKVYLKQKSVSFEKQSETLQEIVQFRDMIAERIGQQASPLTTLPEEHRPVIAKLAHESDKTLSALSKYIRLELLPTQDHGNELSPAMAALPLSTVEAAIKEVMQRKNYGLDGVANGKAPAAVCVWRWEVKEHWDWLPESGREKAEGRQAERIQAKKNLLGIFEALPEEERVSLLDPKGTNKLPSKEMNIPNSPKYLDLTNEGNSSSKSSKSKQKKGIENDGESSKLITKESKIAKPHDPEKLLKEQARLERKATKVEKEKKEQDAQKKSQSLMANFFSKPKPTQSLSKHTESDIAGPSTIKSEFDKTFKPFVSKKDTTLAPINWFLESKERKTSCSSIKLSGGVIVIEDDEQMTTPNSAVEIGIEQADGGDISLLTAKDHLHSILRSLPPPADSSCRRLPYKGTPPLKTYSPFCVRDVVSKLSEAEIAGDTSLVRSLSSQLSRRSLLPAKVFIFTEDARPGYFGTWTRNSRIIGPRTPFAKDVIVFDYSYDSGEEWEEEAGGDDVIDDGDDEDIDAEDVDSDLDSWLVDDDNEESEIPPDDGETYPSSPLEPPIHAVKRKVEEGEKKSSKKRKVVTPLVPFARGPCWETPIGNCEYNLFEPYRIQMFNDTPFPIDPFTFISTCEGDRQERSEPTLSSDGLFVVPNLPNRLGNLNPPTAYPSSPSSVPPALSTMKKSTPVPFPEAHLPFLLEKISALQAGGINFLVEAIYRELRIHHVKKNTIEAKVRQVSEKCKEKKYWIVKPGFQLPS